ncbi:RNA polymerase sigma factor [Carboxylicivirga litoralis]|uniref:RNA polymerase sigma factor n=1 Tax=Carboxylicivirga litoralis TaxID=2816963 RepID=UPI0021CB6282|nr:RNA polymerase sigma factor [Carboxylicivirga sp. A043]
MLTVAMMVDDMQLVEGCRKHERKSQEQLYRKYAGEMLRICLAYEPDRDAAKDILQNAFLKVFRNIEAYTGEGALKAWIRRIITNTAIDAYRKKQKDAMLRIDDINELSVPIKEESDPMVCQDLLREVERLPDGARIVFNLYAIEGYGHKEIAEMLNISEGTSKSQLSRARKLLNEQIMSEL